MPNSCTAREILLHDSVRLFGLPAGSRFRPPCAASPKGLDMGTSAARHGAVGHPARPDTAISRWSHSPQMSSCHRAVPHHVHDMVSHHFIVLELLFCPTLHLVSIVSNLLCRVQPGANRPTRESRPPLRSGAIR